MSEKIYIVNQHYFKDTSEGLLRKYKYMGICDSLAEAYELIIDWYKYNKFNENFCMCSILGKTIDPIPSAIEKDLYITVGDLTIEYLLNDTGKSNE